MCCWNQIFTVLAFTDMQFPVLFWAKICMCARRIFPFLVPSHQYIEFWTSTNKAFTDFSLITILFKDETRYPKFPLIKYLELIYQQNKCWKYRQFSPFLHRKGLVFTQKLYRTAKLQYIFCNVSMSVATSKLLIDVSNFILFFSVHLQCLTFRFTFVV